MTSADSLSLILRRLDEIERKLDRILEELRTPRPLAIRGAMAIFLRKIEESSPRVRRCAGPGQKKQRVDAQLDLNSAAGNTGSPHASLFARHWPSCCGVVEAHSWDHSTDF
jgi:hypothetical protein